MIRRTTDLAMVQSGAVDHLGRDIGEGGRPDQSQAVQRVSVGWLKRKGSNSLHLHLVLEDLDGANHSFLAVGAVGV